MDWLPAALVIGLVIGLGLTGAMLLGNWLGDRIHARTSLARSRNGAPVAD